MGVEAREDGAPETQLALQKINNANASACAISNCALYVWSGSIDEDNVWHMKDDS